MKFTKPALSAEQQIELWKSRGLIVENDKEAAHYLTFIGYYRLSGYALPLTCKIRPEIHKFRDGATFSRILELYCFDRELRLLVMDAIERIEVAFRTCVSNALAAKYGPHWYLNTNCGCFDHVRDFHDFGKKVAEEVGFDEFGSGKRRGRDVFIEHYFSKYTDPRLPPTWMIAEVLSITAWSKCFGNLRRGDQKLISEKFGMNPEVMESWMHSLCYVRNLCAHHARLWNREFTIRPKIAHAYSKELGDNSKFFAQAFVIKVLLERISPGSRWWGRLEDHLLANRFVDRAAMGFPN